MKKSRRSKIALLLAMYMMLMVMPILASAEVIKETDLVGGVLNLSATTHKDKTIEIPSTINEIVINGGSTVVEGVSITATSRTTPLKVTIKNVHITKGNIDIASTVGTTLVIEGVNKIQNDSNKAAITVQPGRTFTIDAANKDQELTAIGGPNGGAGIGGSASLNNGTGDIVIKNGKITATGNGGGAGIGQGYQANGSPNGNIIISGGIISAQAQNGTAAGVGGGNNSAIGNITISGGIVTAIGANGGAGIGAGSKKANDIVITGGAQITATGNGGGAGIGGGNGSEAIVNNIIINNATIIKAEGGTDGSTGGAGIGGGNQSSFNKLTISESTGSNTTIEKAIGGYGSAGIGSGSKNGGGGACEIIIDGGTIVEAIGGTAGAGIGGGNERGCKITITGTALIKLAKGGSQAAGIGSGPIGDHNRGITISGGKIEDAIGGDYGAGIGGGENRGQIVVITGGYIENAQGGKEAAGIGGGKQGQEGSITMTGGIVYAQAGEGADNAIGAGEYPNSDQEEKVLKFTVSGGDVFINGDAKGFVSGDGYMKIHFKLYSKWVDGDLGASTVHVDKNCLIREVIPTGVEAGKTKYDLVFDSNDGKSNSNGIITAILKLPTYNSAGGGFDASKMDVGDFTQLDDIFHGYWFQYVDGDKIMIGNPATYASKADWNMVFEKKEVEIVGEKRVDDHSKLIEMTIPIKFVEATSTPEPINIGSVDNSQSKIVPYSVSNLSFVVPTASEANILEVKDLVVEMDFSNITSKISSDKANITWGVWDKGNYSNTLTTSIKTLNLIQDNGPKKLKLTYSTSMLKTDDFMISLFIPTEHFETVASNNQNIDVYKDVADTNHKLGKKEDVTLKIHMKAKVVTKEEIQIPGISEIQYVPGQKVIDIPVINQSVKMEYADFIKIN